MWDMLREFIRLLFLLHHMIGVTFSLALTMVTVYRSVIMVTWELLIFTMTLQFDSETRRFGLAWITSI